MAMEISIPDRVENSDMFWNFKGEVAYVDEWFLMSSPVTVPLILLAYWSFVLKVGPEYMKNKPAFNISRVLAIYNIGQVAFSCYLFYTGSEFLLQNGYIQSTCLIDNETNRFRMTSGIHWYLIAKLTELLDTVFFVLRKNDRQVTFLHVYHHSLMLLSTWLALKYEPSYDAIFMGTINSLVHVVMYTYYYLSAFPQLSKYLWWKKYITKMQIIQFVLIIIQAVTSYWFSGCPPSYILLADLIFNSFLFIGLFIKFYVSSYNKTNKTG